MIIITKVNEWKKIKSDLKEKQIGFVPTMGHLHEGHLALYKRSKNENAITVASIFVNPTQFNNKNDLEKYPRTLQKDEKKLKEIGVDYLFLPDYEALYPDYYEVKVSETIISPLCEGEFRPGHFDGMLTVVLKLLNIIMPQKAYFGEKDYQQYLLIDKMARAFFLPIEIIPCHTVRDENGLALSSRNSRLSEADKNHASLFYQTLKKNISLKEMKHHLENAQFKVEYIEEKWGRRLAAIWFRNIRLIDNVTIGDEHVIVS